MQELNHFERNASLEKYEGTAFNVLEELPLDGAYSAPQTYSPPFLEGSVRESVPALDADSIRLDLIRIPDTEVAVATLDTSPKFTTRPVSANDLDALVNLDMKGFCSVYDEYGVDEASLRTELRVKFQSRLDRIDHDWVRVAEEDGEPCGFIMSCPTSKSPEDFVSWEDTTDNGTLETTYDPDGSYVYVVSLTMPRPDSGDSPKNMLFVDQIGKLIHDGYKAGYFESRLPGLRNWMSEQSEIACRDVDTLTEEEKMNYALAYVNETKERNGKDVPLDPHLRMYKSIGCKLLQLVPDAYQDGPSMNFGVVAVYENPLPAFIQKSRIASRFIGSMMRRAARSHKLVKKLF